MTRSKPTYTTVASALTPAKIILGWFALSLCSATAFAQDEGSDQDAYIANLRACQAITDPTLRLTCYDQAVGEVVTASDEGDVRIVDREDVKKTRRNLFGFSLPDLGIFGGDDDEEEESIRFVVDKRTHSMRKESDEQFSSVETCQELLFQKQ